MMIDCDSCTVRGAACTDCVVTFLTIPVRPAAGAGTSAGVGAARAPHGPGPAGAGTTSPGAAGTPPAAGTVDLDDGERAAIDVLAMSGLVPPLRLVRAV
jgi:hypothetical protein